MPLSIRKLQNFLEEKGFIANKFFIADGSCYMIEILIERTADIFYLYIPSKYDFSVPPDKNVFNVKEVEIENFGDNRDFGALGSEENEEIDLEKNPDKMEEHLTKNYRKNIDLKDVSADDMAILKQLYRQLKRLGQTVMALDYKLVITYKNYIFLIRHDEYRCISIKHYNKSAIRKIHVLIDLELIYSNFDTIPDDIVKIRESLFRILEKNQIKNANLMERLLEQKGDLLSVPSIVEDKRRNYDSLMTKYENSYESLFKIEKKLIKQLDNINKEQTGIAGDASRIQKRNSTEQELRRIGITKNETLNTIISLREKQENLLLSVDKILYDSNIIFDSLIRNFSELQTFINQKIE